MKSNTQLFLAIITISISVLLIRNGKVLMSIPIVLLASYFSYTSLFGGRGFGGGTYDGLLSKPTSRPPATP